MVELMASLLVFAVITLGITPLLIGSVRGASLSRSFTVGKNLSQEAMERVRGLPFFISFATQNTQVDVLDLYFPSKTGAGYDATTKAYTTTCSSSTAASKECPAGIPAGYTISYVASFVDPSTGSPGVPETYTAATPQDGYAWNSLNADLPPTRLLRMDALVSWTFGAETKTFKLTSLIGDRKVANDRVAGLANLDYTVQVRTSYEDSSDRISDLAAEFGESESRIETRLLSEASVNTHGAIVRLVRPAVDEFTPSQELATFTGATSIYTAPPNTADPAPGNDIAAPQVLQHPDLSNAAIAGASDSHTMAPLKATVANELPASAGTFTFNTSNAAFDGWVNTQASLGNNTSLKLNSSSLSSTTPSKPVLHLQKGSGVVLNGSTNATTASISAADRRVQTTATGRFGQLNLFPVTYINQGTNPSDRVVIRISNFLATADCKSTGTSTSYAKAEYSADLSYWAESDWVAGDTSKQLGNNSNAGGYRTVQLRWNNTSDLLAAVNATAPNNPLVWEDPLSIDPEGSPFDIYLFPISHDHGLIDHDHPGYLSNWSSLFGLASNTSNIDNEVTSASIPGAISLTTVPLDPSVPASSLNITVGSLSCTASDFR